MLGAETKRPVDDRETTLAIDPRQGIRHVDERLHLQVDEAMGGRPRGERFARFDCACIERHHVHCRQPLENAGLARGAFSLRQLGAELERVLQERRGFTRGIAPPGGVGGDLEIPDGARPIKAVFEVVGQERRRLVQSFRKSHLGPFGGLTVQPRSAARCDPAVQHLPIERMGKLVERRYRSVRELLESPRKQNVCLAGQPFTHLLELARIGVHGRRSSRDDRECTILGEARHLEHPLLLWAEALDLSLDHLAETLGHGETDLV